MKKNIIEVSRGSGNVFRDLKIPNPDLEQLRALGTGAAYASVVVLTLYINDFNTNFLYSHPVRLWLVVPVLVGGPRLKMLAVRGSWRRTGVRRALRLSC